MTIFKNRDVKLFMRILALALSLILICSNPAGALGAWANDGGGDAQSSYSESDNSEPESQESSEESEPESQESSEESEPESQESSEESEAESQESSEESEPESQESSEESEAESQESSEESEAESQESSEESEPESQESSEESEPESQESGEESEPESADGEEETGDILEEAQADAQAALVQFAPSSTAIDGFEGTNHTFDLEVKVVWSDSTTDFRPEDYSKLTFEVFGEGENISGDVGSFKHVSTVGNTSTYKITGIPVYIETGSGDSGTAKYTTPPDFYTVKLPAQSEINGAYTITPDSIDVNLSIDGNDLVWTAAAQGSFTCTLVGLISASVTVEWTDNKDKAKMRPDANTAAEFADLVELYYFDGSTYKQITKENWYTLGIGLLGAPTLTVTEDTYSDWTCEFKNLPDTIGGSQAQYFIKIAEKPESGASEDFRDNYLTTYSDGGYAANDGTITNTYSSTFKGTVEWYDAEYYKPEYTGTQPRPSVTADGAAPINLEVYQVLGITTEKLTEDTDYKLVWTDNGNGTWSYEITGMPTYNSDSSGQYVYHVQVAAGDGTLKDQIAVETGFENGHHYNVGYDNKETSTDSDKCYDGGVMLAVLKSNAEFEITKKWFDEPPANRNALITGDDRITLYLWRYSSNQTKDHAAAVTVGGTQLKYQLASIADESEISYTDFTPAMANLPRYDEKGYEFKYFVTESMPDDSGYRQVYGYMDGSKFVENTDGAVYNEGELRNIQSEPVVVKATKAWNSPRLDDYKSSAVVLELQALTDGVWKTVATKTVSGFTTSVREKSFAFDAVEKYDNHGVPYNFRVIETAVDASTPISSENYGDGATGPYTTQYTYKSNPYIVTSEKTSEVGNPEEWRVTNSQYDMTHYTIAKNWAFTQPENNPQKIEITLKQGSSNYATVTIDTDGTYEITLADGVTLPDVSGQTPLTGTISTTNPWTLPKLMLPTYDIYGNMYEYTISEKPLTGEGLWADYNYNRNWNDTGKYFEENATVTNRDTTGEGPSTWIRIDKVWNDSSDINNRDTVTVHVVKIKSDGTIVDMADEEIPDYPYSGTLTYNNGWYGHIRINPADFDVDGGERWAVIEASVGDRQGIITDGNWKTGEIASSGSKPGYTYEVTKGDKGSTYFEITNTNVITGDVIITVDKLWQDANNKEGYRNKALRVRLYQNGTAVAYLDCLTESYKISETVGEYHNEYKFTFDAQDMFDSNGVPFVYTVREFIVNTFGNDDDDDTDDTETEIDITDTAVTTKSKYVSTLDEELVSEELEDGTLTRRTTFTFTNTATAKHTTPADFYVIWRDEDNLNKRPDASYALYYYDTAANEYKLYTGPYKVVTTSADGTNPYYQKVSFTGMEQFDEDGNIIEYFLGQTIINSTIYDDAYYKSNANDIETVTKDSDNRFRPKSDAVPYEDNFAPKDGVIVNTIYDEVKIQGSKLWKNVDAGITNPELELPDAIIYLWRDSKFVTENKKPATETTSPTGFVDQTGLNSNKDGYAFKDHEDDDDDGNTEELREFDKYDEFGATYMYSLTESIIYGGTSENPKHFPPSIMSPEITTLTLQNVFEKDTNRRSITLNKTWDTEGGNLLEKPAARFRLYRGEYTPFTPPTSTTPTPYSVSGIDAMPTIYNTSVEAAANNGVVIIGEEKQLLYKEGVENGADSITWGNLPIFAPNGNSYVYFVCEVIDYVPGYDITVSDLDKGSQAVSDYQITGGSKLKVVVIGNEGLDMTKKDDVTANKISVSYENTYNIGVAPKITGKKEWRENGNAEGVRPTITDGECADIILQLERTAVTQDDIGGTDGNKYYYNYGKNTDTTPKFTVTWSKTSANEWTYTIEPEDDATFPIYAENGNPYVYTVTETYGSTNTVFTTNYQIGKGKVEQKATDAATAANGLAISDSLRNDLKGSITVSKKWDDRYDGYNIRETNIYVTLQRKLKGVGDGDTVNTGWETVAVTPLEIIRGDSWKGTWNNLPLTDQYDAPFVYRAIETQVGDEVLFNLSTDANPTGLVWTVETEGDPPVPVNAWTSGNANYNITNSGNIDLTVNNNANVSIENKLTGTTQLTVTKHWLDSKGAAETTSEYDVRPESITLNLEWRFVGAGDDAWEPLRSTIDDTLIITRTITSAYNWTATFDNLPVTRADEEDGGELKAVQYRAVETDGGADLEEVGGQDLLDSYELISSVDGYTESGGSTTVITNQLVVRTPITIEKIWNDSETHTEDIDVYLCSDNFYSESDSSTWIEPITLESDASYAVTLETLPKYNKDQEEIIYYVREFGIGPNTDGEIVTVTDKTQPDQIKVKNNTKDNTYHVNYYTSDSTVTLDPEAVSATVGTAETTISIVNTPLTKAKVKKEWDDGGYTGALSLRPTMVNVTLQRKLTGAWANVKYSDIDATTGGIPAPAEVGMDDVTISLSGTSWENTIERLPQYVLGKEQGAKYEYRFVETVPTAYEIKTESSSFEAATNTTTTTITNTLTKRTPITVKKVWNDSGSHTNKAVVELYSNNFVTGEPTAADTTVLKIATIELKHDTDSPYSHTWDTLPKFNMDGKEIAYYVKEISANGSNIVTATNTSVSPIQVKNNTADNKYHVNYYTTDSTVTIAPDADRATVGAAETTISIVNTSLTQAKIEKTWEDTGYTTELRPDTITATLQRRLAGQIPAAAWQAVTKSDIAATTGGATGTEAVTVTVKSSESWQNTISNLPQYVFGSEQGNKYEYRFVEDAVQGYAINTAASTLEPDDNITKIKNELAMSGTTYKVVKDWQDSENQDAERAAAVEVELLYKKSDDSYASFSTPKKATLNTSNSWTWNIGALPSGVEYQIKEKASDLESGYTVSYSFDGGNTFSQDGYFTSADASGTGEIIITVQNSYTPEVVSYTAEKIWDGDYTIKNGIRPAIDITLYRTYIGLADPEIVDVITLEDGAGTIPSTDGVSTTVNNGNDEYTYTWANLPKYINVGTADSPVKYEIIYSVAESPHDADDERLDMYGPEIDDTTTPMKTTITNTVQFVTISGTKTWDDENNVFGSRPDNSRLDLTVYYTLDGQPENWQEITNLDPTFDYDENVVWTQDASDSNKWNYVIHRLPKYDIVAEIRVAMIYAVKEETEPNFYERTVPVADEHVTGTRDTDSGNVTGVDFTNELVKGATPLVVTKTKDYGPDTMEFKFQVTLSKSESSVSTVYKGKYAVYSKDDDINDIISGSATALRTPEADGGVIIITPEEQFVITDIPENYLYTVIELAHNDYSLEEIKVNGTEPNLADYTKDAAGKNSGVKGSITGSAVEIAVHNKAKLELGIENITPNETEDNTQQTIGGRVIVGEIPQDNYELDSESIDEMNKLAKLGVAWTPSTYWAFGSTVKINYTPFGGTEKTAEIINFSFENGVISLQNLQFTDAAQKTELMATYPDASLTMRNGIVFLTFGDDVSKMPRKTWVEVEFLPTLAVRNVTTDDNGDIAGIGGKVQVENGSLSTRSDGLPADGATPYIATKVYGTADEGYRLDLTKAVVRNLNDLNGPAAQLEVSGLAVAPMSARGSAATQLTAENFVNASLSAFSFSNLTIAPLASSTENGRFSARIPTQINPTSTGHTDTYVDISGDVVLTRDEAGNITSAAFDLSGLPVPLQIDLLFVPVTVDDNNPPSPSPLPQPPTTDDKNNNRNGGSNDRNDYNNNNRGPVTTPPQIAKPIMAEAEPPESDEDYDSVNMNEPSPQTSDDAPIISVAVLAMLSAIGAFITRKKPREKKI